MRGEGLVDEFIGILERYVELIRESGMSDERQVVIGIGGVFFDAESSGRPGGLV